MRSAVSGARRPALGLVQVREQQRQGDVASPRIEHRNQIEELEKSGRRAARGHWASSSSLRSFSFCPTTLHLAGNGPVDARHQIQSVDFPRSRCPMKATKCPAGTDSETFLECVGFLDAAQRSVVRHGDESISGVVALICGAFIGAILTCGGCS